LDEATEALKEIGVSGMTVTRVLGRGRSPNPTGVYRGSPFEIRYVPHMMIDVVVDDHLVDDVVRAVMTAGRTGTRGDGRVFVMPVDCAYTIRTRAGGAD
jgi:nitrogen regulatory protein PII